VQRIKSPLKPKGRLEWGTYRDEKLQEFDPIVSTSHKLKFSWRETIHINLPTGVISPTE